MGRHGVERAEFARDDSAQALTQLRGLPTAVHALETLLRPRPVFLGGPKTRVASLGQPQYLTAPVGRIRLDRDQAVALQRPDIAAKRRTIHNQLGGKRIDRHRALTLKPREDPVLDRAQPGRRQVPIVELGDVADGLAHGEAVAIGGNFLWACGDLAYTRRQPLDPCLSYLSAH